MKGRKEKEGEREGERKKIQTQMSLYDSKVHPSLVIPQSKTCGAEINFFLNSLNPALSQYNIASKNRIHRPDWY